jgi:hypothetical protein
MSAKRRGRALRRRYGHATSRPSRAEMIAALGLEPEGSKRSQKYDFSTANYWKEIRFFGSRAAQEARAKLGLPEPAAPWSRERLMEETRR